MQHLLLVMAGGALGAASRYGVNILLSNKTGWSTTLVNILGCFCAVWIFTQVNKTENTYLFAVTGFMGAFTTYSAFSIDTMQLLHSQKHSLGSIVGFVLINLLGSLSAAFFAWKLFSKN